MQIICKSGTTIQCEDFEAVDSGVLFYQKEPKRSQSGEDDEEEEEAEDMTDRASGFVPITEVQYVLPDAMVQQQQQPGVAQQQRTPQQHPQAQQQTGTAQQQQMYQPPGPSGSQGGR